MASASVAVRRAPTSDPVPAVLVGLGDLARLGALWEQEIARQVRRLRLLDVPWRAIGDVLGMSKSTLHRRYGWLDREHIAVMRGPDGRGYFACQATGLAWHSEAELGSGVENLAQLRNLLSAAGAAVAPAQLVIDQAADVDTGP